MEVIRMQMLLTLLACTAMAGPLKYKEVEIEESVYGETPKDYQDLVEAPKALQQVAPALGGDYKYLLEPAEIEKQTTFDVIPLSGNQLDDYPPKKVDSPIDQAEYKQSEVPAVFPPPPHGSSFPFLYHGGYPYVYGYPVEFNYGYVYGHAFGNDATFTCPADGRYYRDFGSFYNCEAGEFTVQFCAPGSRNAPPTKLFHQGGASFCDVNMVGGNIPLLLPH